MYGPSTILTTDLPVAKDPAIGANYRVSLTKTPAAPYFDIVELTSGTTTLTADPIFTLPSTGLGLAVSVAEVLNGTADIVLTVVGTNANTDALTGTATYHPPQYARDKKDFYPIGSAVDVLVKQRAILTVGANPSDTNTVTVGGKVYTFQTTLTDVDGNVKIGATASDSIDNLIAAINLGAGAGTTYATSMTINAKVTASIGAGDTMLAEQKASAGTVETILCSDTLGTGNWSGTSLSANWKTVTSVTITGGLEDNKYALWSLPTDASEAPCMQDFNFDDPIPESVPIPCKNLGAAFVVEGVSVVPELSFTTQHFSPWDGLAKYVGSRVTAKVEVLKANRLHLTTYYFHEWIPKYKGTVGTGNDIAKDQATGMFTTVFKFVSQVA